MDSSSTLSCDIAVHRAGSQLKLKVKKWSMRNIFFPKMKKGTFFPLTSSGLRLEDYLPLNLLDLKLWQQGVLMRLLPHRGLLLMLVHPLYLLILLVQVQHKVPLRLYRVRQFAPSQAKLSRRNHKLVPLLGIGRGALVDLLDPVDAQCPRPRCPHRSPPPRWSPRSPTPPETPSRPGGGCRSADSACSAPSSA